ncbi:hypothetical protein FXO38_24489 [Capsicum annuum]|nr:hypothetical protein FXO38_24489 [Capsicum annuum]
MIDQEKIKAHSSVKEVSVSPSGISKSIAGPINEEARHEPSLMDFDEPTPPAEQTPPAITHMREFTQKISVSGGTNHEQVLLKVDMNAIESFVKTYVDKRFDRIEALMKKHHEEMKKQHEKMMSAVVIDIVGSNRDVKKNETDGDELKTPKEQSKDIPDKGTSTDIKSVAFQQFIDNTIAKIFLSVIAIQSVELLQKENLPDLFLQTDNIEVRNKP